MLQHLLSRLPKLQDYSKRLDNEATFVNIPWGVIDEKGVKTTYIFRKPNELIVTQKGDVWKGKWEFLPMVNSLMIDYNNKSLLYNQGFIDDAVMILRKDSTEEILPLGNTNKIPDLNIESYIENKVNDLERFKETNTPKPKPLKKKIKDNGTVIFIHPQKGDKLLDFSKELIVTINNHYLPAPSGKYEFIDGGYIIVNNGKLVKYKDENDTVGYIIITILVIILIISAIAILK